MQLDSTKLTRILINIILLVIAFFCVLAVITALLNLLGIIR